MAIYESGWEKLVASKDKSFRQSISLQFNKVYTNNTNTNKLSSKKTTKENKVDVSRITPLVLPRPNRSILAKLKFYKKNLSQDPKSKPKGKSYIQASKGNVDKIIKIKKLFPKLSFNKVLEVQEAINESGSKDKPKFNMTTKSLSQKQIIIPMGTNNTERIIT